MAADINKHICIGKYSLQSAIYFSKPISEDTKWFKNQTANILTHHTKLSRSLNKKRAIDLTRTSGNFFRREDLLRHLYEFCTFDEKKPLFGNEVDGIGAATAIQGCLL